MSAGSAPPPDTEQTSSTSSVSSTSSTDSLSLTTSPPPRKKSFLSSLFHKDKKDDTPHSSSDKPQADSDKQHNTEAAVSTAAVAAAPSSTEESIASLPTERQSSTGSEAPTLVAVEPVGAAPKDATPHTAAEAYSALAGQEDSGSSVPTSQVLTMAQLVSAAPTVSSDVTPSASPSSATSSTTASATSTPDNVTTGKRSFFRSLLGKSDTDAQPNGVEAKEAEVKPATAVETSRTVLLIETTKEQPTADDSLKPLASRSRSNSDASVTDSKVVSPPGTATTVPSSRSHTDLTGIAPSSPAPTEIGTPGGRRRTLLNTLFKRKTGVDEPVTPATPDTPSSTSRQQEAHSSEELTAIVVEAEQTNAAAEKVNVQVEKTASAMDNLKRLLDSNDDANSGSRQRAASESDNTQPPVRLSSRASTVNKAEEDEQPKSARVDKKLGAFFSSLRLGKHKPDEQHSEQEHQEEDTPSPSSKSKATASSSHSSSSSSSSSSLDYKARMQQLVEKRGGGDRRRSMSDAHRSLASDHSGLSQSSSAGQLKGSSAEVNATMGENNAIAARNVNLLQQMENRAAEMEDAADSMMVMARKIKEDAKKKSLFGW